MLTESAEVYRSLLHEIHRADLLSRRVADLLLHDQLGIGRAMFLVLDAVADSAEPFPSQQAIAAELGLTKAAVSRHVLLAIDEGWLAVDRSRESLRERAVVLTPAGRKLVERGRRQREVAGQRVVENLGAREMQRATRTLRRLSQLLDDHSADDPARTSRVN